MQKVLDVLRRVRTFLAEVRNELRKTAWPTRNELVESTVAVILSVILFSVFVGLSDRVIGWVIRLIVR